MQLFAQVSIGDPTAPNRLSLFSLVARSVESFIDIRGQNRFTLPCGQDVNEGLTNEVVVNHPEDNSLAVNIL